MLKNTLTKLRSKKGFTLMEMLIVVAIIAILIAIAIPTFNGALNKAKLAADDANFRSAKAVAAVAYMQEQSGDGTFDGGTFCAETATFDGTGTAYTAKAAGGNPTHAKGATIVADTDGVVSWSGT